jgi:hypothetical protein
MIYKFNSKDGPGVIELSKEKNKAKFSVSNEEYHFNLIINDDTLYDLIGALHSIQKRIKMTKEANNV